jgi:hypothetical protein
VKTYSPASRCLSARFSRTSCNEKAHSLAGQLINLSFEGWVKYVFDHPVPEKDQTFWWAEADSSWWDAKKDTKVTLSYLTQAFENITDVTRPYSDAQINEGFWFLLMPSSSSHMAALTDTKIALEDRKRCIQSFYAVYKSLFALRCSPHLSHFVEPASSPLNSACYMWWDLISITGAPADPDRRPLDAEILDVMRKTLEIDSVPCQEGALHGLGHWFFHYKDAVKSIIDSFLERNPNLRPELKAYALNARRGNVQ